MEFTKYDMFAYQVLEYLVRKHHYQVVRVQQHKDDIWLMNPRQELYPVIRISSRVHEDDDIEYDYIRNVHRVILNLIQREGPILTLNTNPDIKMMYEEDITQIFITPSQISDEQILTTFHELKDVVHESDNLEGEIANLTKEVEEIQQTRQDTILKKAEHRIKPNVTMAIMVASIIVSVLAFVLSLMMEDASLPYVALGAYYKINIVAALEYWRFLTSALLSPDLISLCITLTLFYYVGRVCEPVFSHKHFFFIVAGATIVGNMFIWVGDVNQVSMGLGAAIYGVIAAYISHLVLNRVIKHPIIRFTLMRLCSTALIMLLLPGMSILNYIGGACVGVVIGILIFKSEDHRLLKRNSIISSLILLSVLIYFGVFHSSVRPIDQAFDRKIVEMYKETPLKEYSQYLEKCYNRLDEQE